MVQIKRKHLQTLVQLYDGSLSNPRRVRRSKHAERRGGWGEGARSPPLDETRDQIHESCTTCKFDERPRKRTKKPREEEKGSNTDNLKPRLLLLSLIQVVLCFF